jgi:hypothetical protein
MAKFTSFEPGPVDGSYFFQDETGKPFLASGPEAERLKAQLAAQPDLRVAGPGGGVEDEEAQMSRQTMSEAPQEEPSASVSEGPTKLASAEVKKAPVWVPWRSDKGGVTIEKAYDEKGNEVGIRERTAGSPGKSKKSLQQDAKNSVAMPSASRETVEGGYDPDEQYLNQLRDTAERREFAAIQGAEADKRAFAAEEERARHQKLLAGIQTSIEAQKKDEVEQRVARERLSYDSAVESVRGKKVDANRLFSGGLGTVRLMAVAIGQALSSYSAAMLGRQNNSWQIVQGAIDRDIAEQEHEIMQGNKNVDNALARLTRSTGSLEQGKLLLKQLQQEAAVAEAQEIGAHAKSDAVTAKVNAFIADNALNYEATREEYMRLAAGKHTAAVEARFVRPTSGTRGGVRPLSLDRADKIVGTEGKSLDLRATEAGIHKTEAEANKANREAKDAGGVKPPAINDVADLNGSITSANKIMQNLGMTWDPKSQKIIAPKGDMPGVGIVDSKIAKLPININPVELGQDLANGKPLNRHALARQNVEGLRAEFQKIISGLALTEAEREDLTRQIYGANTEVELVNGMENVLRRADTRKKTYEAAGVDVEEFNSDGELPQPEPVN